MGRPCICCDPTCGRSDTFTATDPPNAWRYEVVTGDVTWTRNTTAGRLETSGTGTLRISASEGSRGSFGGGPHYTLGGLILANWSGPLSGRISYWIGNALGVDFDGNTLRVFHCDADGEPTTVIDSINVENWEKPDPLPSGHDSSWYTPYFGVKLGWTSNSDCSANPESIYTDQIARNVRLQIDRPVLAPLADATTFDGATGVAGPYNLNYGSISLPNYRYDRRNVGCTIYSTGSNRIEFLNFDCACLSKSGCQPCGENTQSAWKVDISFDQSLNVVMRPGDPETEVNGPWSSPLLDYHWTEILDTLTDEEWEAIYGFPVCPPLTWPGMVGSVACGYPGIRLFGGPQYDPPLSDSCTAPYRFAVSIAFGDASGEFSAWLVFYWNWSPVSGGSEINISIRYRLRSGDTPGCGAARFDLVTPSLLDNPAYSSWLPGVLTQLPEVITVTPSTSTP